MILPPRSTPFPYTTLFRSVPAATHRRRRPCGSARARFALGRRSRRAGGTFGGSCCTDRKSTRLNSSHLGISYAVFCLKKKSSAVTVGQIVDCQPISVGATG